MSLSQAARGSSGSRATLRRVIVVGEVAVSLVLVCGAMLMFRSLLNLQNVDAGVRIANVIVTRLELPSRHTQPRRAPSSSLRPWWSAFRPCPVWYRRR